MMSMFKLLLFHQVVQWNIRQVMWDAVDMMSIESLGWCCKRHLWFWVRKQLYIWPLIDSSSPTRFLFFSIFFLRWVKLSTRRSKCSSWPLYSWHVFALIFSFRFLFHPYFDQVILFSTSYFLLFELKLMHYVSHYVVLIW